MGDLLGSVRLGRSSPAQLDRALAAAQRAPLTYGHPGSTLHPERFPDRTIRCVGLELVVGAGGLGRGAEGLRTWVPQRGLGARVHPTDSALEPGSVLLVVLPWGPGEVTVPNRIVEVVDEADRFGFAYGTLPGHLEQGEECFLVERVSEHSVRLSVRIDAVPGTPATRALAPVVRFLQRGAVDRYLEALAGHVRS